MSLQERLRRARASYFVGRDEQLDIFRRNVTHDIPEYPFLHIAGQGGVGKTTLLRQFQIMCDEGRIPHALTDYHETTPADAMHRLAELLNKAGHPFRFFKERYETYLQLHEKIQKEPDKPNTLGQLFSRAAGRGVVVASRATPLTSVTLDLIGADLVEDQITALSNYLFQKLKSKDDVQLMLDPAAELSPLFVSDLNKISQHQQVVLMFDTFEEVEQGLLPWLMKLFDGRYGDLSEYVSFVFAGRSFDHHDWLLVEPLLLCCNLEPFSKQETSIYLSRHGVTDISEIENIYHLSGGLPVYVAMLANSTTITTGQATRTVVERFLRNIEDATRRLIALRVALARQFDKDLLSILLPSDTSPEQVDALFKWLVGLPFVQDRPRNWVYHPVVRAQMIAYQRNQSPDEFQEAHQKLADYFSRQAQKSASQIQARWQQHAWWSNYVEATYHGLCANPQEVMARTKHELAEIVLDIDTATVLSWVTALKQAADDLADYEPVSEMAALVESGLAALNANKWQEAFKLFDAFGFMKNEPRNLDFEQGQGSKQLPIGWFVTGDLLQNFQVGVDANVAHSGQASSYLKSAVSKPTGDARLMQVIKADIYRGQRLRFSGYVKSREVEEWAGLWMQIDDSANKYLSIDTMYRRPIVATTDWKRYEIVLDVPEESARIAFGVSLTGKGQVWVDDLQFEVTDQDVPITGTWRKKEPFNLDFEQGDVAGSPVGWGGGGQDYELGVDYAVAYRGRASGYVKSKVIEPRNFASLTSWFDADNYRGQRLRYSGYVKSQEVDNWAGLWMRVDGPERAKSLSFDNMSDRPIKGTTDWLKYEIVLDVPVESTAVFFGILLRGKGQVWVDDLQFEFVDRDVLTSNEERIVNYTEALRLNPEDAAVFQKRGWTFQRLRDYGRAIADFNEALRLMPEDARTFLSRGISYFYQEDYERAVADFSKVVQLDPKYAAAYYNLACAFALQENLSEALPPLRNALELDSDYYLSLIARDSDFDLIRADPRFQTLLAEFTQ